MKASKGTKNNPVKKKTDAVNPKEMLDKYLLTRSPLVEQDIMKVLFILYSVKNDIALRFSDNVLTEDSGNTDPLYLRLRNAATGGRKDHEFVEYLQIMYDILSGPGKSILGKSYTDLVRSVVMNHGKMNNTVVFPPVPLLTTVAEIISDYGCKSAYLFNDNLGALSWFMNDGIKVYAHNDSEYHNIIRDVLHDALGFEMNIEHHTKRDRTDACVSFTGIDYYFAQGTAYDVNCRSKSNAQMSILTTLINMDVADVIVFLAHHQVANNHEYEDYRRKICNDGILDMVITLPDNIFSDAKVATSLLVINKKKKNDKVTFISAENVFKKLKSEVSDIDIRKEAGPEDIAIASYSEMAEMEWAFNAHLYIQDASCQEGQELVALKDIVRFKSGFNNDPMGTEVITSRSCSDNIIDALSDIRYEEPDSLGGYHTISGPAVVFTVNRDFKLRAAVYSGKEPCSVFMTCYSLIPETEKILPQYLAYVLLTDKSIARYIKHVLEYYADVDGIRPVYLLNRKIPIHREISKQLEVIRPFIKEEQLANRHNIILALSDERATSNDYMSVLAENNMRVLGTCSSVAQLQALLNKYASEKVSAQDRADAVVVDADIRWGLDCDEVTYDGLIELSYIYDKLNIPFCLLSAKESEDLPVPRRVLSYFTNDGKRRFFLDGLENFNKLLQSMRDELESEQSDDSLLRNKYDEFYEAADWVDSQRPGMDFAVNVTRELKADMNCSQEEMGKAVNGIRILAENIMEWLKEVNLAPSSLDPGAVAIMLRDKVYRDYMYPDQNIMDEGLASMIATLYKIGNDGSHKFLFTDLYRRTAIMSLMALVQWTYRNRDLFARRHEGFYISNSVIEVREFVDVVQYDDSNGEPYYYTRNVHLGLGRIINIKAGDKVRVSGYILEKKMRREDLGVIYYSDSKNWSKIN